ncbi:glycosyltransferase [Acinetobacter wuhouensis]|uniref:Glycosyltransferase family 4 protein n=1 Tax=Acinetobacter wuhouensis TaxID=1879050 RepID=A0A4Q7AG67_9GAMM|nr:glycosyltransferase [Acinetobacter wuhouensis]RZG46417.1 glycosyltransferase family 4 protein [Acinetobacter wuhouensis]
MNIYFLTNGLNRTAGTERVIIQLAQKLKNVKIIVPGTTQIAFSGCENLEMISVGIGDFPVSGVFNKIRHRIAYLNKIKKMQLFDANSTVISFAFDLNLLNIFLAKKLAFRPIICEHIEYNYHSGIRSYIRKKAYVQNNVTLVCLTETDKLKFEAENINVVTIPNFITPVDSNYNTELKQIVSIGRLEYQKNFGFLIDAFFVSKIYKSGWRLKIVGEGAEEVELQNKINELKMEEFITIHKFTKEIEKYYSTSSLLCMTSRFEAFPMVLLEALNYGLPVLVTDFPTGAKEILGEGNPQIVKEFDVVSYAKALTYLCSDDSLKLQFSADNLQLVKKYYPKEIVASWEQLINNI